MMPHVDPGPPPGHPAWKLLNLLGVGLIATAVSFFLPAAVFTFIVRLFLYMVLVTACIICSDVGERVADSYQWSESYRRLAGIVGFCVPLALLGAW